jgi:hypothetical protein
MLPPQPVRATKGCQRKPKANWHVRGLPMILSQSHANHIRQGHKRLIRGTSTAQAMLILPETPWQGKVAGRIGGNLGGNLTVSSVP